MAEAAPPAEEPAAKGGTKALLFGLLGGLVLGAAAFLAIYLGLFDPGALFGGEEPRTAAEAEPVDAIGFVPLDPIVVSLPRGASARHLRFVGQLEVVPARAEAVIALMPRILDALNTYLRAVEPRDLEQPAATVWLRAQMLRRIQVVTGEGHVRDLLISEFVLN